jgi:hypothetical protein
MVTYYKINFGLMQHHKWSLEEIENMMPWERDVYMSLLIQHLEEENDRIREQERNNR